MAIERLYPNAAGYYTGFTSVYPIDNEHWESVDEVYDSPDDADYVSTLADNSRDSYNVTSSGLSGSETINSVCVKYRAKGSSTSLSMKGFVRLNDTNVEDYYQTLTTSYANYDTGTRLTRPGGGDWAVSDLASLEIGIRCTGATKGTIHYCSQCYVEIDYTSGGATEDTERLAQTAVGNKTVLARVAETAIGNKTVLGRLAHSSILQYFRSSRLAEKIVGSKISTSRLSEKIVFPSASTYYPTGDGYKVGTWTYYPASPTTYYDKVDDTSPDDASTYVNMSGDDWVTGDEILFTLTGAATIPVGSGLKIYARSLSNGTELGQYYIVIRKNSTDYISSRVGPTSNNSWKTDSYLWNTPPWGGQDWGAAQDIQIGFRPVLLSAVNYIRFTQIYIEVIRSEGTIRLSEKTGTLQFHYTGRLAQSMSFPAYSPTWWDANYKRRAELSFGTNHSELPVGYTSKFNMVTGYEFKVPYNVGVTIGNAMGNEAIQHSGRQMAYYNGVIYITWIGYKSSAETSFYIYIKKYAVATGAWSATKEVASAVTGQDSHHAPVMMIDNSGYIHLFYGAHYGTLKYRKSTYLENINIWNSEQEIGTDVTGVTYPRPIMDTNGDLYVFLRADLCWFGYYKSTDGGANWGSFHKVVDYSSGYVASPAVYCGGAIYVDGRMHLVPVWWDGYGSYNKGRAISYIYSDDFTNWKYADGTSACTTDSSPLLFATSQKVVSSPTPFPDTAPWYHTNTEGLAVDSSKRPYFLFQDWFTEIGEECNLWLAKWNGSSWSTTNLSGLTGAKKMWRYRNGGVIYLDREEINVYAFVKPDTSAETYFGGEIYKWRGTDFGTNWSYEYLSANSGFGCGMMNVFQSIPSGLNKLIFLNRARDLYIFEDIHYPYVRYDGADVRVVRSIRNNDASYTHTEFDRLPDRFHAEDSEVYFKTDIAVPANYTIPHAYNRYWVYYNYYNASNPPRDSADVFTLHDGFEAYTGDSDLNGQGGWSGDASSFYVRLSTHTQQIHDGENYVQLDVSSAKNIRKALTLDNHLAEIWVWLEGNAGYFYLELYDSSSGKYIRIGCGTIMPGSYHWFHYKKGADAWVQSSTGFYFKKFIPLRIKINSSGVTLWGDGNAILTDDNYMTSATHVGFGCDDSCSVWIDSVRVTKYVSNIEEMTVGTPEGTDNDATSRVAHKIVPQIVATTRLSQKTGELQFSDYKRLSEKADVSKMETVRLSELIVGDKTLTERIAEALTPHKVVTTREAHTLALEAQKLQRVAHFLATDKTLTTRMMSILSLDKTDIARIAESLSLDKASVIRLMNLSVLDKNDIQRISQTLNLHYLLVIRICHALAVDKIMTVRLAQLPPTAIVGLERLSETLALEKQIFERLHHTFVPDKTLVSRVAQYLATEKHLTARLASLLNLEDEDTVRIAEAILTDKTLVARLSHDLEPDKTIVTRLAELVPLEAESTARLAAWCALDAQKFVRIAELLSLDKTTTSRLAQWLEFAGVETIRLAEMVSLDKITTIRIPELVSVDKLILTRLAMAALGNKTLTTRIAEYISLEATGTERLSETLLTDKTVLERIANGLLLRYVKTVRLCQTLVVDKYLSSRYAHRVPIYYRDLFGMYITGQDLENLRFIDYGISNLGLTGAAISNLQLTSPSITNLSLVDADIKRIRIIDAELI